MKEQLLIEIKEDLRLNKIYENCHIVIKGVEKVFCQECEDYKIRKERIKTKLQEWHRMASLWLDKIDDYQWDNNNTKIGYCDSKELSTFIQKIEKIAKEQGVELK